MQKYIMIILFWGVLFFMAGQAAETDAIKPYVSKIKASIKDSQVILTWENPENVDKTILVYKYKEQIAANNISKAEKIATLDATKESFIYYPTDTGNYFYAVQYALSNGEPNNVFISFRNITTKAVNVATIGSEEELATRITGITAKATEDNIIITFKNPKPQRELILYRSTNPILTVDSLLEASFYIVLDKLATTYKDYPIPTIEYYYAILDAELVKIGKIELVKNENTTTIPVNIKLSEKTREPAELKSNRSLPLPLLSLTSHTELSSELSNSPILFLPEEKTISPETEKSITTLLAGIKLNTDKKQDIEILDIDKIENKIGEAYALQQILNNFFKIKKWEEAKKAIGDFLLIKHAADIEGRSHFYLGQIYFFQNKYREAFLEFLIASDKYYTEVQSWIDNCFENLIL